MVSFFRNFFLVNILSILSYVKRELLRYFNTLNNFELYYEGTEFIPQIYFGIQCEFLESFFKVDDHFTFDVIVFREERQFLSNYVYHLGMSSRSTFMGLNVHRRRNQLRRFKCAGQFLV